MLSRIATISLIAVTTTTIACGRERAPEPGTLDTRTEAFLAVTNDHFLDVTVYVLRAGTRQRLATVTGMQTDTIPLRLTIALGGTPVRLLAEPVGSNQSHVSDQVQIDPGDWVLFTVRNPLNLSSVTVWQP